MGLGRKSSVSWVLFWSYKSLVVKSMALECGISCIEMTVYLLLGSG